MSIAVKGKGKIRDAYIIYDQNDSLLVQKVGGMKGDKEIWRSFFVWLKERGFSGARLIIGDKNFGMLETISESFPDGKSALMFVCARLRHVAEIQWGARRYMNMDYLCHLEDGLDVQKACKGNI